MHSSQALWIDKDTVAWPIDLAGELVAEMADTARHGTAEQPAADLAGDHATSATFTLVGYPQVEATPTQLRPDQIEKDRRAASGYLGLKLSVDGQAVSRDLLEQILKGPVVFQARADGSLVAQTHAQIAGVLDDLYQGAADAVLGAHWNAKVPTLALWAPTARSVALKLWLRGEVEPQTVTAVRDDDGVWTVQGTAAWEDAEYLWDVHVWSHAQGQAVHNLVTDPYSVALTVNSTRSVLADLSDPRWAPHGWQETAVPPLRNQAAQTIYELHVRDFSAWDASVPKGVRGTYRAFTLQGSHGVRALRALAEAGLTTVHLLPTFDIATSTINEDRDEQKVPAIDGVDLLPENQGALSALDAMDGCGPSSALPQEAVMEVRDQDAFNWGYDPFHWLVPEGSYATTPNQHGGDRTREYRKMVAALHDMGLHVVQDVVFNHTTESGQSPMSVLDRIVPGYYHRLCPQGKVESSTCCANTATEHLMMEKLMVDALVHQARVYKVNGFRFDLMGHHSMDNMRAVRQALDALTLERDGVDGKSIYLYGEGWNFGEVANDALFTQATQANIGGSGIGAFNDRLRDAVRGGRPFDPDQRSGQGFGTGLFVDPSEFALEHQSLAQMRDELLHLEDLIKVGLIGALKDYRLRLADGTEVPARQVDYNGMEAAFARAPQECVNYVEAHDNETLYDNGVWRMRTDVSLDTRLRLQVLSNAIVALGQGPAFWASGTELLRSKSLDRDSYNSGDWFNAIVWDRSWNQFGKGLPLEAENGQKWAQMGPLLRDRTNLPDAEAMALTQAMSLDFLRIRASSPLFTLGDAEQIKEKVTFPNSVLVDEGSPGGRTPGVIIMANDDRPGHGVDPRVDSIVVVFNSRTETWSGLVQGYEGRDLALCDVQTQGADPVVRLSRWDGGVATVPARTVAVFVEGAQVS